MSLFFNKRNSRFLNWALPTEEILQVHGLNRPVANLPVVDFRSQPLDVRFFFSYFDFLRCSRPYWNVTITLKIRYVISSFKPSCSNSLMKSVWSEKTSGRRWIKLTFSVVVCCSQALIKKKCKRMYLYRRSIFTNDCDFLNDHGVDRFFMFLGSLFNISF